MKKIIFRNFAILSLISIIIVTITTSLSYYVFFKEHTKEQIKSIGVLLKNESDISNIEKKEFEKDIRVTIIEKDGTVLFDNYTDKNTMSNHNDREEIISALKTGEGYSVRKSDTSLKQAYYYAIKMTNGNILRISKTLDSVIKVFVYPLPSLMLIVATIMILALFLSQNLAKKIVAPINVEHILSDEENIYDELLPFRTKIRDLNNNNLNYIEKAKNEKRKIQELLENTKEGILLLDLDKNILLVNNSAKTMLDATDENATNILEFSRDTLLQNAIDESISKGNYVTYLEKDKNYYQIFANKAKMGIFIIILDITATRRAEIIKKDFASNVSHELKTPLTTIKGFSEMIASGMITDTEDIKKYSNNINKETERLISLISHIIRLSEIEETSNQIHFEKINLIKTTKVVLNSLENLTKNIEISINDDESEILGDPQMICELIANLIENAIKYNKENGKVKIEISNKTFKITDTGIGIPKIHQDRIFERFYRVDKSRSKETGGTGLGLSIVKHIAECHNAKISLNSMIGVGTTIKVEFPK